jgi:hypothetical protein
MPMFLPSENLTKRVLVPRSACFGLERHGGVRRV